MKLLFTTALLVSSLLCCAQKQNVYLLKNNGEMVNTKDSADFLRIVREPEEGEGLYDVLDYYLDGKQKLIGKSSRVEPVKFEGTCLTFFKNGKRKSITNYHSGRLINELFEYFPNGKVHVVKKYPAVVKFGNDVDTTSLITEAYDSLGVAKVVEGKGYYTGYNDDFTEATEEGPVENGKRTGDWKGADKKDTVTFTEKYVNGVLITGVAVKNGKTLNYTNARVTRAAFAKGDAGFGMFLARAIRYPAAARERNIQGTVILKFTVNKDGSLSNIRVINSVEKSLDNEAARAMGTSAKWAPATKYGIPVNIEYTVPIQFALATYGR
ncbi:energy transducer TonB [Mucilaginibacter glaciei]|uniref:TonB family protein n=1 Tax=Mucilaginibacter glaciei TaxID=2772109 RepID=A0A926NRN3_9SPHI|nr:energy transducer TonB [Mucilaginibacter glaciei]MBD1393752.1 TonB family protein [Mucilaginibacter glaciei]